MNKIKLIFLLVFVLVLVGFAFAYPDRTDIVPVAGSKVNYMVLTGTASTLGSNGNPMHVIMSGSTSVTITADISSNTFGARLLDANSNPISSLTLYDSTNGVKTVNYMYDRYNNNWQPEERGVSFWNGSGYSYDLSVTPLPVQMQSAGNPVAGTTHGGYFYPYAGIYDNINQRPMAVYNVSGSSVLKTASVDASGNTMGGITNPFYIAIVGYPMSAQRVYENSDALPVFVDSLGSFISKTFLVTTTAGGTYSANLITPTAGTHISTRSVSWKTPSTSANGVIKFEFLSSAQVVENGFITTSTTGSQSELHLNGNTNEPLTLNITSGGNAQQYFVTVTYKEE